MKNCPNLPSNRYLLYGRGFGGDRGGGGGSGSEGLTPPDDATTITTADSLSTTAKRPRLLAWLDQIDTDDQAELNKLLAEFIYASGLPFNIVGWHLHLVCQD